jgi:hypothetical protein
VKSLNGADGISDIEGQAATGSGERAAERASFNGADGISDIEGKAARVAASECGQRASFKFVSEKRSHSCSSTSFSGIVEASIRLVVFVFPTFFTDA